MVLITSVGQSPFIENYDTKIKKKQQDRKTTQRNTE